MYLKALILGLLIIFTFACSNPTAEVDDSNQCICLHQTKGSNYITTKEHATVIMCDKINTFNRRSNHVEIYTATYAWSMDCSWIGFEEVFQNCCSK
jgi:hypothetical protein